MSGVDRTEAEMPMKVRRRPGSSVSKRGLWGGSTCVEREVSGSLTARVSALEWI